MGIKNLLIATGFMILTGKALAQNNNVTIGGGVDFYYSFNFNQPASGLNNYLVSHHKHNEFNINLAYLNVSYKTENYRINFSPAAGTYMEANYASEPIAYRNILDANIGIKLSKHKAVWLDAGIFASPIGDEGYYSKDQLNYTRSFASEHTPYYLCGIKFSYPVTPKLNANVYVVNGWQQITDVNRDKSVLAEIIYKPNKQTTINYNTYLGNHYNKTTPNLFLRNMHNAYIIYNNGKRWQLSANALFINQQIKDSITNAAYIYSTNIKARYKLKEKHFINARFEYYEDTKLVDILPLNPARAFNVTSLSAGYDFAIAENVMLRFEGRRFVSDYNIFDEKSIPKKLSNALFASIAAWF